MSSANPKCPNCGKTVYFAEKVRALNADWHKLCFKCKSCNIRLEPGKQTEHDGDPYCKRCYDNKFRHQGYGFGGLDSWKDPDGVHPESEIVTTGGSVDV